MAEEGGQCIIDIEIVGPEELSRRSDDVTSVYGLFLCYRINVFEHSTSRNHTLPHVPSHKTRSDDNERKEACLVHPPRTRNGVMSLCKSRHSETTSKPRLLESTPSTRQWHHLKPVYQGWLYRDVTHDHRFEFPR